MNRQLYHYGTDESVPTYATNYVIVGVVVLGLVCHLFVSPPKAAIKVAVPSTPFGRRFTLHNVLWFHLIMFAASYLFAGIVHQSFYFMDCPGTELMVNETNGSTYTVEIACPEGKQAVSRGLWGVTMFLQLIAVYQMVLLVPMTAGCMERMSGSTQKIFFFAVQALTLVLAIAAGALHSQGWFIVGISSIVFSFITTVAAFIGARSTMCGGKRVETKTVASTFQNNHAYDMIFVSFLLSFIGLMVQLFGGSGCSGPDYTSGAIYRGSCSFPFDGRTGFNHNALYHILEIVSKIVLVLASRRTVLNYTGSVPIDIPI